MKKKTKAETVTVKGASVKIYSTPSTKAGKEYPAWTLAYTQSGKRTRKTLSNLDEARKVARSIAAQLADGTGHAHALTPAELADYQGAVRVLRQTPGVTLLEASSLLAQAWPLLPSTSDILNAVRHYREHLDKQTAPQISFADLSEKFLKARKEGGASPRYLEKLRSVLKHVTEAFRCNIGSVTTLDLQAFVDRKNGASTRRTFKSVLSALFNYAKKQGFLDRDRATEAEHIVAPQPKTGAIGIYQPADLARVLAYEAAELERENLLAIALGAFTGIRSSELHRLEWRDIGPEHITVAADRAKTAQRRLVPILPGLRAVLDTFERGRGRIFSARNACVFSSKITAAFRAAGVQPVHNGLRHSFCTYRLADVQSTAQVALEAGNSPQMLFQHYRELATHEEAAAWFAVRPTSEAQNVISISKAA